MEWNGLLVKNPTPKIKVPTWKLLVVLIAFPAAYVLNSFTPWASGLFVQDDRSFYFPFWTSALALHWLSVVFVVMVLRRHGHSLADIGLALTPTKGAVIVVGFVALGAALVLFREAIPYLGDPGERDTIIPVGLAERSFFILIALSAGFCEELVYRGFCISGVSGRGLPVWAAVIIATLSFVFVHGIGALFAFPLYFISGLLFAALYLWRKNLLLPMIVHCLIDLSAILAP